MTNSTGPIWNPFRSGYRENPYEQLKILREQKPVHKGINGSWMLFKYDDVKFFLTSPAFRTLDLHEIVFSKNRFLDDGEGFDHLASVSSKWLLFLDPPEHTELRPAINKIWHSYNLGDFIPKIVEETLAELSTNNEIDLVRDFAGFIPSRIVCKMLGLQPEDYMLLRDWAYHFIRVLEPFETIHALRKYNEKAKTFYEYLQKVIETKDEKPDDAFISSFLEANRTFEKPLTEDETISALCVLFFAGIETSVNLFSQSILLLLKHPDQFRFVVENEVLSSQAADEFIRYITPTQYTKRIALQDIEIRGQRIKTGDLLMGSMASANHDPDVFDEPERFDLERTKNPHLSFGHGLHFCVGARLARQELSVAIPALFRRFPRMALNPEKNCEWDNLILNRTLKSLPVILNS